MIQFKKVILHNFGSYGHAELELQNRGFCLVTGQNLYTKDNAISNGSGKSFLWSAICYALTGETISGIKSNLKNINTEEPDCFVQLDFLYDRDMYSILRTAAPRSDLKIFKNDIDLSGKGIRESEKKLQELLPELTKDLIASTIIIGQGMPNKFSSFSPSGRKELLEKLTKSDFMIEDVKTRITTRQQELITKIRELEDSILANKTQLNGHLTRLNQIKDFLDNSNKPDFDVLLANEQAKIDSILADISKVAQAIENAEKEIEDNNARLLKISEEKAAVSSEELTAYTDTYTKLTGDKAMLNANAISLSAEIKKLKSIADICPTCGQHIPNVHKPDTSSLETKLTALMQEISELDNKILNCNTQHQKYILQINEAFNSEIEALNSALFKSKQEIQKYKTEHSSSMSLLDALRSTYDKLLYDKSTWDAKLKSQQAEANSLETEISKLTNLLAIASLSKEDLDQRLAISKKMDSLIRRDFRGYLLANIIDYIDNRAKDYCSTVFGTRELSLSLNGNSLDITYCNKPFDGLSGGEKQRVDLILQLAIRDLLSSYLGLSANILVLDEVTDFLDKKSCRAVMHLLENELKTVESVFIISHHAEELEIPVDSEVKVLKNEDGISEIY